MFRGIMIGALFLTMAPGGPALADAKQSPQQFAPVGPKPLGRPGDWISDNDYPKAALSANTTGVVGFVLTISDKGVPTACEIATSSNSADLDAATCDLVMQRAQFTPAYGVDGKPTTGYYHNTVRWQIPIAPVPHDTQFTLSYDVLPDGTTTNCTANLVGQPTQGFDPSAPCKHTFNFQPPVDAQGKPIGKHVVMETKVTVTDKP